MCAMTEFLQQDQLDDSAESNFWAVHIKWAYMPLYDLYVST
jgi:hypothetical protein